ncbi:hypothetical protein BDC45DRAFT_575247 [Circinella umbellata]|nr:hypothetical protein BDC45DRAFT_575247 [Circinella umbellata]
MDEIIVIGLDAEWNFDKTTKIKRKVSVLQLAYENLVYVFYLNNKSSTLPVSLVALLKSDRILKTGKMVDGDLGKITRDFISSFTRNGEEQEYCQRGLELGSFCRDHGAISDGRMKLSRMCEVILGHKLPKEDALRLSNWNTITLSTLQITSAALNALVPLQIYNAVHSRPVINQSVTKATPHGTYVSFHPGFSRRLAAYDVISEEQSQSYNSIVIDGNKISINIINDTNPAALIDSYNTSKPSETFDNVPFLAEGSSSSSLLNSLSDNNLANTVNNIEDYNGIAVEAKVEEEQEDDAENNSDNNENPVLGIDEESMKFDHEQMDQALQRSTSDADTNDGHVYSRVLKDVFHLIDSVYVSLKHGLLKESKREDSKKMGAFLNSNGRTWKQEMERNSDWLLKRVKRVVPPPQELIPIVPKLFENYGPLECSKTGHTQFTRANWKQAANVLEAIRLGHVSDPPGLSLYLHIATDKNNSHIYKCFRGTNSVEGGIHQ